MRQTLKGIAVDFGRAALGWARKATVGAIIAAAGATAAAGIDGSLDKADLGVIGTAALAGAYGVFKVKNK